MTLLFEKNDSQLGLKRIIIDIYLKHSSRAATYNMNLDQFYTRWFYTVRDDQGQDGSFLSQPGYSSAGGHKRYGLWWLAGVGVIVPWHVYQQYGDLGLVRKQYPSMVRFMNYLERKTTNYIQTSYVLPLQFGLFNEENKPKAVRHLLETVKASNYCLTTGFVGTPYICLVLSDAGHPEEAYRMFLNSEYPSWLFPVKQGATTFWERWNSYTLKNGFGPVSMNSFNHYAYGAIEEWMMSHCLGIQRDEQQPGYKHILLQPEVSDSLRYAKGGFETMYGHVTSEWEHVDGGYTYHAVVPANTTATLSLVAPSAKAVTITTGAKIAKNVGYKAGKAIYTLPAGTYSFMVKE